MTFPEYLRAASPFIACPVGSALILSEDSVWTALCSCVTWWLISVVLLLRATNRIPGVVFGRMSSFHCGFHMCNIFVFLPWLLSAWSSPATSSCFCGSQVFGFCLFLESSALSGFPAVCVTPCRVPQCPHAGPLMPLGCVLSTCLLPDQLSP